MKKIKTKNSNSGAQALNPISKPEESTSPVRGCWPSGDKNFDSVNGLTNRLVELIS